MLQKNKGCLCENIAVCWLQENGYFVFKGAQTQSAIDLIAVHPTTLECQYFDVKMSGKRKDGSEINTCPEECRRTKPHQYYISYYAPTMVEQKEKKFKLYEDFGIYYVNFHLQEFFVV